MLVVIHKNVHIIWTSVGDLVCVTFNILRADKQMPYSSAPDLTINHSVIEHTTYSNLLNVALLCILKL